jgi:dTDP-4-dehydrorhamnose reductase
LKVQLEKIQPSIILLWCLYRHKAESEVELADLVNHHHIIAQYAKDHQVKLIHVSTDYVLMDIPIALTEKRQQNLLMFMELVNELEK